MLGDLVFALRLLRRAPAFTATAVLTLALGIGANTGIFSLINGFLRPLPVPDADRIVLLLAELPGDDAGLKFKLSFPALQDYRAQANVFSDLMAFDIRAGGFTSGGRTSQFLYHVVSGNFFSGLGVVPALGRFIQPDEGEHLGGEDVVVLGYTFWTQQLGGDPGVMGAMVRIDGRPVRVVGVAPKGFRGLAEAAEMDGYLPLNHFVSRARVASQLFEDRGFTYLTAVGRLKPGVSVAEAQAALDPIARRLSAQYPATDRDVGVRVTPEPLTRPIPVKFFASILPAVRTLLFTLATLVLVLACLNVVNLLFVRASVRQREMAVRAALGSGRWRLIRILLLESSLLAVTGAALGVVLGLAASGLLIRNLHLSADVAVKIDVGLDWRVFFYGLGVAGFTALVIGIVPAWRASRTRVTDVLHDGGRGGSEGAGRQRIRGALVIAQVAGSLALLVVAGFFVRSLRQAQGMDLGFDAEQLITLRMDPGQLGYDTGRTETFYDELLRRVRAMSGVESAAISFTVPMGYILGACTVEPEGAASIEEHLRPSVPYNSVGDGYFATLKLPILRGRAFDDRDMAGTTPVAIVNETLAARLWPGRDPIGQRIRLGCVNQVPGPWQIVGVARDSKYIAVFEKPTPYFYVSLAQAQPTLRVLQVRSALPVEDIGMRVQREVTALDADVPVGAMRTMRESIDGGIGNVMFRVGAVQAAALGLLGLVLAVVGVYGVVSYGANQRVREMGIRLALGADPAHVRGLILKQGARLVAGGVILGLAASALLTTTMTRFLVLVSATDPITFVTVTTVLVGAALIACYLPARRAMKVNPIAALRHE